METCSSLLDLPDEVLLEIFSVLPSCDIGTIGQVCQRFFHLSCVKNIIEVTEFSSCTSLSKFNAYFSWRARTMNITVLNLQSCSWMVATNIVSVILKCKNLKSLNVTKCGLHIKQIIDILSTLSSINTLTYSMENKKLDLFPYDKALNELQTDLNKTPFDNLINLKVELHGTKLDFLFLNRFLSSCLNLEELYVNFCEFLAAKDCEITREHFRPCSLKKLHTFLMEPYYCAKSVYLVEPSHVGFGVSNLAIHIFEGRTDNIPWKKLSLGLSIILFKNIPPNILSVKLKFISNATHIVFHYPMLGIEAKALLLHTSSSLIHLEFDGFKLTPEDMDSIIEHGKCLQFLLFSNCTFQYDVSAFESPFKKLFISCYNIKELNLLCCHFIYENTLWDCLCALKKLCRLALPVCAISAIQPKETPKFQCKGTSDYDLCVFPLYKLSCECNIEDIDIRGCTVSLGIKRSYCLNITQFFSGDQLTGLSNMKRLKSVTLVYLPRVKVGSFLQNVASNCKFLKTLRLNYIGSSEIFTSTFLKESTPCFMSLHYLKLEARIMYLGSRKFWEMICSIYSLKQLCIISKHFRGDIEVPFLAFQLKGLKNLEAFHVHAESIMNHKMVFYHISEIVSSHVSVVVECYMTHDRNYHYRKHNCDHLRNLCLTLCDIAQLK